MPFSYKNIIFLLSYLLSIHNVVGKTPSLNKETKPSNNSEVIDQSNPNKDQKKQRREKNIKKVVALIGTAIIVPLIIWIVKRNPKKNHIYDLTPKGVLTAGLHYKPVGKLACLDRYTYDIYNVVGDGNCWVWSFIPLWLAQTLNSKESLEAFESKIPSLIQKLENYQKQYEQYRIKAESLLEKIKSDKKYLSFFKKELKKWKKYYLKKKAHSPLLDKVIELEKNKIKVPKDLEKKRKEILYEMNKLNTIYYKFLRAKEYTKIWLEFQIDKSNYHNNDLFNNVEEKEKLNLERDGIGPIVKKVKGRIKDVEDLKKVFQELKDKVPKVLNFLKELRKIQGIIKQLDYINTAGKGNLLLRFIRLSSGLLNLKDLIHTINLDEGLLPLDHVFRTNTWGSQIRLSNFITHFHIEAITIIDQSSCDCGISIDNGKHIRLPYYTSPPLTTKVMMFFVNGNHYQFLLRRDE